MQGIIIYNWYEYMRNKLYFVRHVLGKVKCSKHMRGSVLINEGFIAKGWEYISVDFFPLLFGHVKKKKNQVFVIMHLCHLYYYLLYDLIFWFLLNVWNTF